MGTSTDLTPASPSSPPAPRFNVGIVALLLGIALVGPMALLALGSFAHPVITFEQAAIIIAPALTALAALAQPFEKGGSS